MAPLLHIRKRGRACHPVSLTSPIIPNGAKRLNAILLLILVAVQVHAQDISIRRRSVPTTTISQANTNNRNNNPSSISDSLFATDSAATTGLQYHTEIPDSILRKSVFIFPFRPTKVKIDQLANPSLAPTGIQRSDPLDAFDGTYYLGKGIIGHPHVNIIIPTAEGLDMALQPDPNIGYTWRPTNIRLYQAMRPYTLLSYNSSLNKDYLVRLTHTQNPLPGWNIAFDYRLIQPEGTYTSSGATNHYLDFTTNYFSKDSRLQATTGVIWQKFTIDENGGITDDSYFTERLQSNRAGIPINITNASTTHREFATFAHGSYNLVRQFEHYRSRDSLAAKNVGDSLLLDTISITDTLYPHTPLVVNPGIIAFNLQYDRRKRLFADSTFWRERSANIFWTNDAYPDHRWLNPIKLTIGVSARQILAAVEDDTLRHTSFLDPFAQAILTQRRLQLTLAAETRQNIAATPLPDSRLQATLSIAMDSTSSRRLAIDFVSQSKTPDLRPFHDAHIHQNITLQQETTQRYSLQYIHNDLLDISLRASHINHHTWYDTLHIVHQVDMPLWLFQAALKLHIKAGPIFLDSENTLQHSTDNTQIPVPLFATKNSLYADFSPFKRTIRTQVGIDLKYHTPFYAPTYDPYTGLFLQQDLIQVGNYLWADLFLNINIKQVSFYIKAGHLNALWESSPSYFILPHYPGQKFGLFWGLTWQFFD